MAEQGPGTSSSFRFTKSDAPALKETADILKDWGPRDAERIIGYVIRLVRGTLNRQGTVTISSPFGRGHRNIKVNVDPDDYSRLSQANNNRSMVSIVGNLSHSGRGWILENPHNLQVNGENVYE